MVQPCGAQVGPSGCATGTEIISLKRTVAFFNRVIIGTCLFTDQQSASYQDVNVCNLC